MNLTYYPGGRLKRAMRGADVRGSTNTRVDYTYSLGSIQAIAHVGTSPLYERTYWLDATGRCSEYKELKYTYSNSSLTEKTEVVFTYNAKGQLQTATDKSNAAIRTEYSYNADGNLSRATRYHPNPSTFAAKIWADDTFVYDQPTGGPILKNGMDCMQRLLIFPIRI
ncbi:hypothetical protein [Spirosoma fluminis]